MNIAKFSPFPNGKSVSEGAKKFLKAEVNKAKFEPCQMDEILMSGISKPRNASELKENVITKALKQCGLQSLIPDEIISKMSENSLEDFSKNTFLQNREIKK